MFITVSYSDDWGFENRTFTTHREAFEHMAGSVKEQYGFDMMEHYPINDSGGGEEYIDGNIEIYYGSNWCNCYHNNEKSGGYSDHWTIIEV